MLEVVESFDCDHHIIGVSTGFPSNSYYAICPFCKKAVLLEWKGSYPKVTKLYNWIMGWGTVIGVLGLLTFFGFILIF